MTGMTIIHKGAADAVSALIAGLEREFGQDAGRALADRFLAAEDADFCWEARVESGFSGATTALRKRKQSSIVSRSSVGWMAPGSPASASSMVKATRMA